MGNALRLDLHQRSFSMRIRVIPEPAVPQV
jgi:hypothetical protein